MSRWVEGEVVNLHRWTDNLYSLQLLAPIEPFQAGQFTRLAMDIDGERVARPYSYVNGPDDPLLEFYFITVPDGPLTRQLVEIQAGDGLWVAPRAAGFLTLAEVPEAPHLWMLSTGTAIGPFLSILTTDEVWSRFEQIVLVHAVRTVDELTYRDKIRAVESRHPEQFRMVPFVTREDTDFAIKGRIPQAVADGRLEEVAGLTLSPDRSQMMICGNPAMVRDTTAVLEARGFKRNRRRDPGHITTESYWKEAE
jgi:ferredoxin--NADP+ reductase